jgi:uncharacterized membrane protein
MLLSPAEAPRHRALAWLYSIGGLIGLIAAFTLLVEKIELIKDPTYVPSCSINPILSCGSIMGTGQAELLGFPNPIIGVASFSILTTIGFALLAGATMHRWFWMGLQAGALAGVVFVHWLVFQSLYRIGALCPYCMVVWAVTIPIFWYTTLHVAKLRAAAQPNGGAALGTLSSYHGVILTVWFLSITGLIAQRFWGYWVTLLT